MGHLIAGNKSKHISGNIIIPKENDLVLNTVLEEDTIVASKSWVKENLDKVKEWATEKE